MFLFFNALPTRLNQVSKGKDDFILHQDKGVITKAADISVLSRQDCLTMTAVHTAGQAKWGWGHRKTHSEHGLKKRTNTQYSEVYPQGQTFLNVVIHTLYFGSIGVV